MIAKMTHIFFVPLTGISVKSIQSITCINTLFTLFERQSIKFGKPKRMFLILKLYNQLEHYSI